MSFGACAPPIMKKPNNARPTQKKLRCPECGKTFTAPQGLSGHMRYIHGFKKGTPAASNGSHQAAPPSNKVAEVAAPAPAAAQPLSAPSPDASVSALRTGAREYLVAAVDILRKRDREIEDNILRLEALRAEKEAVGRELEAVNAALRTFDAATGRGD